MKTRFLTLAFLLLLCPLGLVAAEYKTDHNVAYHESSADDYARERCVLDVYYPQDKEGFATLVWFHGGGLDGGEKFVPKLLKDKGICVVAVNYRLSPRAQHPAYIEDAAAAVAWTVRNIAKYGGDSSKVHVSGHSAVYDRA